jgi:SsrA-binding protein
LNLLLKKLIIISMSTDKHFKAISTNKRGYYDFSFTDKFEVGIVLKGHEVKSLRQNNVTLRDAYARIFNDELWLIGCHIPPYKQGGQFLESEPHRSRKLLIHKRMLKRLIGKTQEKGLTLIPLKLYFKGHLVKLEVGLGKAKKLYDKRQVSKERDLNREMGRTGRRY